MVLDGNALAGALVDAIGTDATAALVRCGTCGRAHPLGMARVDVVAGLWTVHCPSCAAVTLVVRDGALEQVEGAVLILEA